MISTKKLLYKVIQRIGVMTPIASVEMYAGATAPSGWLLCDGSAVSRTTYANLFAAIGTTYGTGDGSTTFNLPDLKDRVPIGASTTYTLGSKGGASSVTSGNTTLTTSQIPAHTHGSRSLTGTLRPIFWTTQQGKTEGIVTVGSGNLDRTASSGSNMGTAAATINATHTHDSVGGGQAHNHSGISTIQPYTAINYIIYAGV